MTDLDRDDALDHLSSDELEAQAFGPDPDARRGLRGLLDRPTPGALTARAAAPRRRWPLVLGAFVAGVVAFAGVDLALGTGGGPDVFVMAEGPDAVAFDDEMSGEIGGPAVGEEGGPMEIAEEAEDAVDDGGIVSDGPAPGDAVFAD